jgi:hypothetical protein
MNPDLQKVLQSKCALRRDLAARPVAEKLAMLDALRESTLALRAATSATTGQSTEKSSRAGSRQ